MEGDEVRFGILGTGVVGKTIAARLASLGHDVIIGTRTPAETLSRTESDAYGNPRSAPGKRNTRKYGSAPSAKQLRTVR